MTGNRTADSNAHDGDSLQRHVVLEALSLPERIELLRRCPDAFSANPNLSEKRLTTWRHLLGVGVGEPIPKRLASLGIEAFELDLLLGDIRPAAIKEVESPDWWAICERVLARGQMLEPGELPTADFLTGQSPTNPPKEDSSEGDLPEQPLPFEHALAVWIEVGTDLLRAELAEVETILGPVVLRREQRGLLENLCTLARSTLLARYQYQKLLTYDSNDLVLGLFMAEPPREAYIATVQATLADGFADLMRSYPALAHLLATRVECWVRTLVEFARRLEADRPLLERVFNADEPLGALVAGGRGISDSHNGGRAVVVCRFECGTTIVYKPRSMSIDEAWNRIVEIFNSHVAAQLQLKTLAVLNRGGYGWMEFSARAPCEDEDEVRAYYSRMGSLLALIHALQGNDFPLENVVAAGPYPVAIDLETISVPEPLVDTGGIGLDPATEQVGRSVLRTLLLPSVMAMRGREGLRNLGAVGVEIEGGMGFGKTHRRLDKINTDFLRWVTLPGDDPRLNLDDQSKVERADGETVDPDDYRSEVVAGYHDAYRSILEHQASWLAEDGPLAALEDAWVRVLNRATNIYYRLLLETCDDRWLDSGVDRWIHGDRLLVNSESATSANETLRATGYALIAIEQEALLRGDVAYFLARGGGEDYFSPNAVSGEPARVAEAQLKRSAIETARKQISAMGENDLNLQIFLMESSYLAAQVSLDGLIHGGNREIATAKVEPPSAPAHDDLEAWILRALEQIDSLAIRMEGRANWIDAQFNPMFETVRPNTMATDIYGGRGGLALLFERAYRQFSDTRWLELARQSIGTEFQLAHRAHESGRFTGFDLEGPAGMNGSRSGLIAACWVIGRHEGQGVYRELAKALLTDLSDRIIERDTAYDVIGGSAGYLLLAMQLEREEAIPGLEPLLEALGDHLARHTTDIDGIGWVSSNSRRPLNGFGHGRAGIGLALLEIGTRLNRVDLRELGLSALRAEHQMRADDPGVGWPDLRGVQPGDPLPTGPQINAWCAGSDGIALGRSAAMAYADDAFLREDLEYAMACMETLKANPRNHLCCGSGGRAEAWRTLGQLTGDPTRFKLATTCLAMSVDVQEVDPTDPECGTMGLALFQGTAGRIWTAMSEIVGSDGSAILLLRP
ncbi:MAG: type 2 lanthipeptide synthetase LanM [Myxococcota bacterium]